MDEQFLAGEGGIEVVGLGVMELLERGDVVVEHEQALLILLGTPGPENVFYGDSRELGGEGQQF